MRDAISLLDQCIALGKATVTREDVVEVSGLTASETIHSLARAIIERDAQAALLAIKKAMDEGRDLQPLCTQLVEWFRNLMLFKTGGDALNLIELDEEELQPLKEAADSIPYEQTLTIIKELSEIEGRLKWSENQRILLEVTVIRLCSGFINQGGSVPGEVQAQLESRLLQLEKRLAQIQEGKSFPKDLDRAKGLAAQKVSDPMPHQEKQKHEKDKDAKAEVPHQKLLKQWPEVIEYIRSVGKMKVYAYLLDTQCMLAANDAVQVVVSSEDGLKKTVLSRNDSLEVIKDALHKITGYERTVKIIDDKALSTSSAEEDEDPALDKIKQFAAENHIPLNIEE